MKTAPMTIYFFMYGRLSSKVVELELVDSMLQQWCCPVAWRLTQQEMCTMRCCQSVISQSQRKVETKKIPTIANKKRNETLSHKKNCICQGSSSVQTMQCSNIQCFNGFRMDIDKLKKVCRLGLCWFRNWFRNHSSQMKLDIWHYSHHLFISEL